MRGIWRGSRTVEPPIGNRPRLTSKSPKVAEALGHPDVGALEDLGAARDAVPLDGGDHRFPGAVMAQHGLPVEVGIGLEPVPVLLALHALPGQCLEVHPGAEGAPGAGEHDRADRVVLVGLDPAVVQADQHRQ